MVKKLRTDEFEAMVTNQKGMCVIDFFATWCGPCKMLGPIVEKVSEEMTDVAFYKVDVDEDADLAIRFKVMNVPTLLFFRDGELVDKSVGVIGEDSLKEFLR